MPDEDVPPSEQCGMRYIVGKTYLFYGHLVVKIYAQDVENKWQREMPVWNNEVW